MKKLLCAATAVVCLGTAAQAERLALQFIPPDIASSDVCNVVSVTPQENQEQAGSEASLDVETFLGYLERDIRSLKQDQADRWYPFISELITMRADIDAEFAGIQEAFERIDLLLAAGREKELRDREIVQGLTLRLDELTNSQKVELAKYYRFGIGVNENQKFGTSLLVLAAFEGNSSALMELTRLQMRGEAIDGWDIPVEETATLAFGGMIGQANKGMCARAERIAREYIDGEILVPNPDLALAWRKFAADIGGSAAAWKVVETHLNATANTRDDQELMHYLGIATGQTGVSGIVIDDLIQSGARTAEDVRNLIRFNAGFVGETKRHAASQLLQLQLSPPVQSKPGESELLIYLRQIAQLPSTPPQILTRWAREASVSLGRWQARDEVRQALERAARLDDPQAKIALAQDLLSMPNDPGAVERAENLLLDVASRHQDARAMSQLDALYRCRLPSAPLLIEAEHWARSFLATDTRAPSFSAIDLVKLSKRDAPETLAAIQTHAMRGNSGAMADHLHLLQSNHASSQQELRFWANRVSRNDQSLENFVLAEYDLARTELESANAVELIRRAYLDIGPAIALETALTLIQESGRDPEIVKTITALLEGAASRGEGASIRLLARLNNNHRDVYETYAPIIEQRGDFLANIFALSFAKDAMVETHFSRAVSLMNCTVKDALELADAANQRGLEQDAIHWLEVGAAIKGGNPLSKLGLSDLQMARFNYGAPPKNLEKTDVDVVERTFEQLRRDYLARADENIKDYNAGKTAEALVALFSADDRRAQTWALNEFFETSKDIQRLVEDAMDIQKIAERAAVTGDGKAAFWMARQARRRAITASDLTAATNWLKRSAEAGFGPGMVAYGEAIGHGIGTPKDPRLAIIWLERAEKIDAPGAAELMQLFVVIATP